MKKYLFLFGLVIIIIGGLFHINRPDLESISLEILKNNKYSGSSTMPDKYDSICKIEKDRGIFFPNINASYAKLTKNDYWKNSELIEAKELTKLLVFLNDSSSYRWGELGTPEIHYYLTYYNKENKCIGLTTIDLEGMAYSYPSIAKMKWGMLKEMKLINELIFK